MHWGGALPYPSESEGGFLPYPLILEEGLMSYILRIGGCVGRGGGGVLSVPHMNKPKSTILATSFPVIL